MSPTVFNDKSIDELARALVAEQLASPTELVGCDERDIGEVQGLSPFPLPADYVAFLRRMGRRSGMLFQGSTLWFPALAEATEVAYDIAEDPAESLTVQDRFFFGHHQGYKVYFFQRDDPAVYHYYEGHPEMPAEKLAGTFGDWAWNFFNVIVKLRKDSLRDYESRQREREAMGLPERSTEEFERSTAHPTGRRPGASGHPLLDPARPSGADGSSTDPLEGFLARRRGERHGRRPG